MVHDTARRGLAVEDWEPKLIDNDYGSWSPDSDGTILSLVDYLSSEEDDSEDQAWGAEPLTWAPPGAGGLVPMEHCPGSVLWEALGDFQLPPPAAEHRVMDSKLTHCTRATARLGALALPEL
mmetsp:Transcript_2338/g.4695  ORF Transcript_2338/g.4695 Transcript_2338/m.4695 type:complete len:122 (+) Transcript_2338:84-449(+)